MIGSTHTTTIIVDDSHSAATMGSGDLPVLATPAMVAAMENAAMQALGAHLEPNQTSVGTAINVQHTRATPLGATVAATATITLVAGRRIEFEISAKDMDGEIGHGVHVRFIVDREKFMSKL